MKIPDLISPDRIAHDVPAGSKKRVLELISELVVDEHPTLTPAQVFESLTARERLGSTGIGHGAAIPHGRLKDISESIGAFIHLNHGIDFDSIDEKPVDLLFALLVPQESTSEHLDILSGIATMFSDERFCNTLRAAGSKAELLTLLSNWKPEN